MINLEVTDSKQVIEFLTNQHINNFINGIESKNHPITDWMVEHINLPDFGDHLETPRMNSAYTHHGIYIGNKEVVHYAGLSDGLQSAPVEIVSISEFAGGEKYTIIPHPHKKYSNEEVVKRGLSRVGEDNYGLLGNNCEHFVNWCIYNINRSNQVSDLAKNVPYAPVKMGSAVIDVGKSLVAYANGDISKEKLFDDIQKVAVPMSSSAMYATFGTVVGGPVGGIIAGTVGYVIGNLLHKSGLFAFGDSAIVTQAKNRRKRAEKICNEMIPLIQESRKNLEAYMEKYFSDRKVVFDKSFENIEISLKNNDNESLYDSLEKINNEYGKTLGKNSFNDMVSSNEPPKLF